MNITKHYKALGALVAAVFAVAFTSEANAGSRPEVYMPVKTMKEAQELSVGTVISYSCGNCGAFMTTTVPRDNSHLKGFTCPACGRTYRVVTKAGRETYLLSDGQNATARLLTVRKP